MEAKAKARFVGVSARKSRLVADLIRGKKVGTALNILSFTPKASARIINKLLKSALANASQNKGIDLDNLFVKTIFVNEGPTMKRFRPRPMGRAGRIRKRTSHITIILEEK